MAYSACGSTSASSASTETPPKAVSSFDHLVTQWMSQGTSSNGSDSNSSRLQVRDRPTIPSMVRLQSCSTFGVGPAVSTGNPFS